MKNSIFIACIFYYCSVWADIDGEYVYKYMRYETQVELNITNEIMADISMIVKRCGDDKIQVTCDIKDIKVVDRAKKVKRYSETTFDFVYEDGKYTLLTPDHRVVDEQTSLHAFLIVQVSEHIKLYLNFTPIRLPGINKKYANLVKSDVVGKFKEHYQRGLFEKCSINLIYYGDINNVLFYGGTKDYNMNLTQTDSVLLELSDNDIIINSKFMTYNPESDSSQVFTLKRKK